MKYISHLDWFLFVLQCLDVNTFKEKKLVKFACMSYCGPSYIRYHYTFGDIKRSYSSLTPIIFSTIFAKGLDFTPLEDLSLSLAFLPWTSRFSIESIKIRGPYGDVWSVGKQMEGEISKGQVLQKLALTSLTMGFELAFDAKDFTTWIVQVSGKSSFEQPHSIIILIVMQIMKTSTHFSHPLLSTILQAQTYISRD